MILIDDIRVLVRDDIIDMEAGVQLDTNDKVVDTFLIFIRINARREHQRIILCRLRSQGRLILYEVIIM